MTMNLGPPKIHFTLTELPTGQVSWLTWALPRCPWSEKTNKQFQKKAIHAMGLQPFPPLSPGGTLGSSVG